MSPKRAKTGAVKKLGSGARVPKAEVQAVQGPDAGDHRVTFSFRYADRNHDGAWSWATGADAEELLHFLCDIGNLSWNEVKAQITSNKRATHKKHHFQPVSTLCPEAQARITQLHLDEVFGEDIFRFRLSGQKRLWGFIVAGVFYVLWWDAPHEVYPVEKD